MDANLLAVGGLVLVALSFDYINGFHDAANSIATVVSTRVLSPGKAVIWAAFFNFAAAFLFGTAVAKTVGAGMVELSIVSGVGRDAAYGMVVLAEGVRATLDDPNAKSDVEAELAQLLNKVNQVVSYSERLKMLVAVREPWTVENGCLTPTMKIKRSRIEALAQERLDAWYSARAHVVWGDLGVT